MQALEAVKVFKYRFYGLIDHFIADLIRRNQRSADTKGIYVCVVTAIKATGNNGLGVVRAICDQFIDFWPIYRDQDRVYCGGCFLNGTIRVACYINHGINVVVAQSCGLLSCAQFGCKGEVLNGPAQRFHDHVHGVALT